ncbi:MAG: SET domain-containing protein-lysine N-methyltransferase [Nanoarchaeota archaeon]
MVLKSVVSPKIEIRRSKTHQSGMFVKQKIHKDEIVFIKGGHILSKKELFSSSSINSYIPISDQYYIGATNKKEEKSIRLILNHSCNPNCGMRGEITFVAMRDIKKNEELTIDYSMVDNENYKFRCNCGEKKCRKNITGFDWRKKLLQKKYKRYFAQYLKEKMRKV